MAAGGQAAGCRDGPVVAGPLPGYEDQVRDALPWSSPISGTLRCQARRPFPRCWTISCRTRPQRKRCWSPRRKRTWPDSCANFFIRAWTPTRQPGWRRSASRARQRSRPALVPGQRTRSRRRWEPALAPAAEPARRTRRSLRSSTLTRAHGPRAKLTSRLPLPAAEELSAAWQALETTGWQVYANVVLPDGQYLRLTARAELREFADHLESLSGGAAGREGGPAVSVQVRAAKALQRRHTTLSAVVTVFHLGWRTPEDGALADNALHDLVTQLTARRHRVRWRKDRPSPPPPG